MAQTITIQNYNSLNILTTTNLTADMPIGSTVLAVENTNGFVGGPTLIGGSGNQTAELVTSTAAAAGTSIPISATTLKHYYNDQVQLLFGDSVNIYRANDQYGTGQQPDDVNFSKVATVPIDANSTTTSYNDASGTAGDWYKYTYYNSTSQLATNVSDSAAAQAGQVHYVSLDDIRDAAGFNNANHVTDQVIAKKRDAAEKEINGALQTVYQFPLPLPTNPIVAEIAKQLAAGMLVHELYSNISVSMAKMGDDKASAARNGGGSFTSLQELVMREVVLTDANFVEQTLDDSLSFGGYPDATQTDHESGRQSSYFHVDEEY